MEMTQPDHPVLAGLGIMTVALIVMALMFVPTS